MVAEESLETDEEQKQSKFRDPEDGRFDITGQILGSTGFVPLPFVITEPAVNYGGGLAILYFWPQAERIAKGISPDVSGIAGFATGNKTYGGGVFHAGFWRDDSLPWRHRTSQCQHHPIPAVSVESSI
jgi:hypothetical protein